MKIVNFESRIVTMPLNKPVQYASAETKMGSYEMKDLSFIFAKVSTDDGIIGYGAQTVYNPKMSLQDGQDMLIKL